MSLTVGRGYRGKGNNAKKSKVRTAPVTTVVVEKNVHGTSGSGMISQPEPQGQGATSAALQLSPVTIPQVVLGPPNLPPIIHTPQVVSTAPAPQVVAKQTTAELKASLEVQLAMVTSQWQAEERDKEFALQPDNFGALTDTSDAAMTNFGALVEYTDTTMADTTMARDVAKMAPALEALASIPKRAAFADTTQLAKFRPDSASWTMEDFVARIDHQSEVQAVRFRDRPRGVHGEHGYRLGH